MAFLTEKQEILDFCSQNNIEIMGEVFDDGSFAVMGNFNLSNKNLQSMPVNIVACFGNFDISNNNISSFEGVPHTINGYFNCSYNNFNTLQYFPTSISGYVDVRQNKAKFKKAEITSICSVLGGENNIFVDPDTIFLTNKEDVKEFCNLHGIQILGNVSSDGSIIAATHVNLANKGLRYLPIKFNACFGDFNVSENQLSSLIGVPQNISGFFNCSNNNLSTLDYFPRTARSVDVRNNKAKFTIEQVKATCQVTGNIFAFDLEIEKQKIKEILQYYLITYYSTNYTINDDLTVDIEGDVDLRGSLLTANNIPILDKIPVQFGKVTGSFNCIGNNLKNLIGAPKIVNGDFACYGDSITLGSIESLEGVPETCEGEMNLICNQIKSLKYLPKIVKGTIYLDLNEISSFDFAPVEVKGGFSVHGNQISSLKGSPSKVGGDYWIGVNSVPFTIPQVRSVCEVVGQVHTNTGSGRSVKENRKSIDNN